MKMESSLTATVHGRVREVLVSANAQVPAGKPLLQIEPLEDDAGPAEEGERVAFEDALEEGAGGLRRLEWLVLGYDFTPQEARRAIAAAEGDVAGERALLDLYADVRTLNRPHANGDHDELGSPQEHLHAFMRSLDAEAEGLPERYVAHLERALAHYGVESLDRTAALEEAAYRLFLSQQRAGIAREAVRAILAHHLETREAAGDEFRAVLDRLEAALEAREPALAELAREVRWRCYDERELDTAREVTYDEMAAHLAALADGEDRDEHLAALVDCPQPLFPLLGRLSGAAGALV
jgi:pyruvate/2-oxoglutarate dehydrogenase complex dihydrolipoamide acyltransferase (E2) component